MKGQLSQNPMLTAVARVKRRNVATWRSQDGESLKQRSQSHSGQVIAVALKSPSVKSQRQASRNRNMTYQKQTCQNQHDRNSALALGYQTLRDPASIRERLGKRSFGWTRESLDGRNPRSASLSQFVKKSSGTMTNQRSRSPTLMERNQIYPSHILTERNLLKQMIALTSRIRAARSPRLAELDQAEQSFWPTGWRQYMHCPIEASSGPGTQDRKQKMPNQIKS